MRIILTFFDKSGAEYIKTEGPKRVTAISVESQLSATLVILSGKLRSIKFTCGYKKRVNSKQLVPESYCFLLTNEMK